MSKHKKPKITPKNPEMKGNFENLSKEEKDKFNIKQNEVKPVQTKIDKDFNKKITEGLKDEIEELMGLAKEVRLDYLENPSNLTGSIVQVHQNSPALDTEKDSDEPLYSGSRWVHVIKTKL